MYRCKATAFIRLDRKLLLYVKSQDVTCYNEILICDDNLHKVSSGENKRNDR